MKKKEKQMMDDETEKKQNIESNKEEISENGDDQLTENNVNFVERIKELEEKNQELNDRLLRRLAEFENYKRRTEQDQMNILKFAAEPFIVKILPIYDDLTRSLLHVNDENNTQSLKDGLRMVYEKFTKVLNEQGVAKIECKGKEFDFNFHEALMQQVSTDVPPHTVLEEVEAGYLYKEKVIKHAKVIVSTAPVETAEKNAESNKE